MKPVFKHLTVVSPLIIYGHIITKLKSNFGMIHALLKHVCFSKIRYLLVIISTVLLMPCFTNAQYGDSACSGVQTVQLNMTGGTLIAGTDNTIGAKYKYSNVNAGGSTPIDVIAELIDLHYGTYFISSYYSFNHDVPASTAGIENNFQPSFIATYLFDFTGSPSGINDNLYSTWKFSFVLHSDNTVPVSIPLSTETIDNDGGITGGITIQESVTYLTTPTSIALNSPTNQTISGNTILGPTTNQAGIGTDPQYTAYAYFGSVNSITVKFNSNITVTPNQLGVATDRYASIAFGCTYPGDQNFTQITISGNVYDDANGLTDNTVNGTGTNAGANLYAILYDNTTGQVSSITTVASNGTYSLNAASGDNYTTYLSSTPSLTGSSTIPTITLPSGWVNTGEYFGSGAGNDGTVNGILSLGTLSANVTNANFGIDKQPTGTGTTTVSQTNPGNNTAVAVPLLTSTSANTYQAQDNEDGTYSNNLSGKTVTLNAATNGTLYYNGIAVTTATAITNFDPTKVTLDPTGTGITAVTATFTYAVNDNAGIASANITVTVPFTAGAISITGYVWDDANGSAIKETPGAETFTNAGGLLYVNLVLYNTNVIVSSVLADAFAGTYSFSGAASTKYNVILSNGPQTVGATLTASSLPTGWINTGQNITGVAIPVNQTGIITFTTPASDRKS